MLYGAIGEQCLFQPMDPKLQNQNSKIARIGMTNTFDLTTKQSHGNIHKFILMNSHYLPLFILSGSVLGGVVTVQVDHSCIERFVVSLYTIVYNVNHQ